MKNYFSFFFVLIPLFYFGQTISGTIKDIDGNNIPFSNILIKENSNPSSIIEFTNARNGKFSIVLKKEYETVLVELVAVGFYNETFIIEKPFKDKSYNIEFVLQKDKTTVLKEVIITSDKRPYSIKKDTLTYNIEKYKDGTERKIQDVLKKLPGIEVNEKSGEIKYKGKSVETVTLDGDNLFGYNYSLGTKNINIDMLEQVQAIENYSDNPLLKDIEGGEKVSINLKLKKGKTDYSGTLDFGLGINEETKLLNNTNASILGISKNYKSFGILSFNNIGINHTPFDYFSGNKSAEQFKEKDLITHKVISESLFSTIIDDERANINNMLFSNYNSIFKLSKRFSVKTNLYYLNDNINYNQIATNENSFNNEAFSTIDNFKTNKKPQFYRGDIELKYNSSKNSLVEYRAKFNYEEINTNSSITANTVSNYNSKLLSKNILLNQKIIFTNKLNKNQALQFQLNHSLNNIPQNLDLNLLGTINTNNQKSTFKKHYLDFMTNLLGTKNQSKYSIIVGSTYDITLYNSINNLSSSSNNTNLIKYTKKSVYNLGSINFTLKKWSFIPSYSIKYLNQILNDRELQEKNKGKNILFEPSLLLRYKINNKSFVSSKVSLTQNPFSEENIFKNPVFINNRIKINNTPSLEIQENKSISFNYYNNNLYKNFFLSIGINYQENNGNYFSDFIINENETIINNFYLNEKNNNIGFNLSTEKFIRFLSTTFKLISSYSKTKYKNIINLSELRDNTSNIISNEFSIKTAFNTKINFENNATISYFSNKTTNSSDINNSSFTNSLKLKYRHSENLFSVISGDYFTPNTNNKANNYLFLDFSIVYKPTNKKYEFNLIGKNLLNNTSFSQTQISDFSRNTLQNNLISRYVFVNFTYNL